MGSPTKLGEGIDFFQASLVQSMAATFKKKLRKGKGKGREKKKKREKVKWKGKGKGEKERREEEKILILTKLTHTYLPTEV